MIRKLFSGVVCLLIASMLRAQAVSVNDSIQKAVIRSTCELLLRNYVYPEKADSMVRYLQQQQADRNTPVNANDFAQILSDRLHHIYNDKHLRIIYEPDLEADIIAFNRTKKKKPKPSVEAVARDAEQNFFFKKAEVLPCNIGYLEFNAFAPPGPEIRKTIQAAMRFVSHTDALILDLRNNTGGNGETALEIASYFFGKKTYAGRSYNRIENRWTDLYIENQKNRTGGIVLNMPVCILVSGRTYSAAEGLAYTLQTLRNAELIGQPTRGGAHLTRSFALGNGFVGFIPYSRTENSVTKTDWEANGLLPEQTCTDAEACLSTAQLSLLRKKLETAGDETQKRKLQWWINYHNRPAQPVLDAAALKKWEGEFAEFDFRVSGTGLVHRNLNQPDHFITLVPLGPSLFLADDTQIEFVRDADGQCNAIKMYWSDGWMEEIKRTR